MTSETIGSSQHRESHHAKQRKKADPEANSDGIAFLFMAFLSFTFVFIHLLDVQK